MPPMSDVEPERVPDSPNAFDVTVSPLAEPTRVPTFLPLPPRTPEPSHSAKASPASFLREATNGLRFELVANELDGGSANTCHEPFAVLSDRGRYSRVLLGRVVSGGGRVVRDVAVKIQRDVLSHQTTPHGGSGAWGGVVNNECIEDLWRREHESLSRFADAPRSGVVQILDLMGRPGGDVRFEPVPPVLYCRDKRVYFHPPCPQCGALLRVCKDDAHIEEINKSLRVNDFRGQLGLYDKSTSRALWCPTCAASGRATTLYVRDYEPGLNAKDYAGKVLDSHELYGSLGKLEDLARENLSQDALPCIGCDRGAECFGERPGRRVVEQIVPLSFYDFHFLPLECLHLQYNHATQVLGGRSFSDLSEELRRNVGFNTAQLHLLDTCEPALSSARGLLYPVGHTEQHALEVLKLKLGLFRDICRGLVGVHGECGPHLDLKPENIMAKVSPGRSDVPPLWSLDAHVIDLASAKPFFPDETGNTLIFEPPHNYNTVYTDPVMADQNNFNFQRQADLELLGIARDSQSDDTFVLQARLRGGEVDAAAYSPKDTVTLTLRIPHPEFRVLPLRFLCERTAGGALNLRSVPTRLTPGQATVLDHMVDFKQIVPNVSYSTYKCFHIPCDLYSLGILLFQTLLETNVVEIEAGGRAVRRGQSIVDIKREAEALTRQVESWLREQDGFAGTSPRSNVAAEFLMRLDEIREKWKLLDPDQRELSPLPWCAPANLFYDPIASREASSSVPESIFDACILIALRLITNIDGFSFCRDNSDFDPSNPAAKILEVLEALDAVYNEIYARLFHVQDLSDDVHDALDEMMGPPVQSPPNAPPPQSAKGAAKHADRVLTELLEISTESKEERVRLIRDVIRGAIAERSSATDRDDLARLLRARFPLVSAAVRNEKSRLEAELTATRSRLRSLFSLDTDLPPERASRLDALPEVCELLIEFVDAQPRELEEIRALGNNGTTAMSRSSRGPLRDAIKRFGSGEEIDLVAEVNRMLTEQRVLAVRLLAAHQHAVHAGLQEALEQLDLRPLGNRSLFQRLRSVFKGDEGLATLRRSLLALKGRDAADLQQDHFWRHFQAGFRKTRRTRE